MKTEKEIEDNLSIIIDHADLEKDVYMRGYYNALIWVTESCMYFETVEEIKLRAELEKI